MDEESASLNRTAAQQLSVNREIEMTKGLILYQSKYGATQKYADWLVENTGFDCVETKSANRDMLSGYDIIILGGGVYASSILGIHFVRKNIDLLKHKKLIVFYVGVSPYDETAHEEIKKHNLKNISEDIPFFYCRGAWNEESLTFKDRALCKLLKKMIAKKDPSEYEPWMKALMSAIGQKKDWTNEKNLIPLLECIKE